ncbi:MAG: hypothetical protein ABIP64_16130 [Burkholderiales bacterium]
MPTDHINTAKAAGKTYFKEVGLLFTFFTLMVTFSNIAYKLFGFRLVPIVKIAFETFHDWCHLLMQVLVFSWLTFSIEWMWYGFTWLASLLMPIIPWRPHISIPGLVTDIALVSLAFTRVFQSADLIVPRAVREEAERGMTDHLWHEFGI